MNMRLEYIEITAPSDLDDVKEPSCRHCAWYRADLKTCTGKTPFCNSPIDDQWINVFFCVAYEEKSTTI